jgi:LacI family transcriptional regulator, galactose operon repressor
MAESKKNKSVPGKPTSLRALGDYLNLSPATISLVLNNAPGIRSIPQETRNRVLLAAKQFDYRPSFYARALRKKQTFSIGVLVPELSDGYSREVMNGIEEVLLEEGYFYLTASHHRKKDLIEEYPRLLMDRAVEGFIAIDTPLQQPPALPIVAVAGHTRIAGVTNLVLDHRKAAELALHHLHKLGHRNIAFMRGQPFSADSDDRWGGLVEVAQELGIQIQPELVIQLKLNLSSPELGYPTVQQLLDTRKYFSALLCFNDIAAIGAIRAFRDLGFFVPDDVSVIGFDDIQSAAYHNPSLTTIRQPLQSMGSSASRILLERLQGKEYPDRIMIAPELVVRESTSKPNTESRLRNLKA